MSTSPDAFARYALFGHPVAHTLSPAIHAAFARDRGISVQYGAIDALPEQFPELLARFAEDGGAGANVTLPLKQQAVALCDELGDHARRAGAVNTLVRRGNGWLGLCTGVRAGPGRCARSGRAPGRGRRCTGPASRCRAVPGC